MLQLLSPERVANASTDSTEHVETGVKSIAPAQPSPTQDALQSIRIGLRSVANETARNIQQLSQATVKQALEIGQRLWRMQRDLKRKEYGAFLGILGWASTKARKFINLAKVFDGFLPSQLIRVELTTLLSLCSKRYQEVVAQLRETQEITQQLVDQLMKQSRTPRKPVQDPISGWKQSRSGGGRYYNVLLQKEEVGLSIEQQASSEGVLPQKVIEEAVALRSQHKSSPVRIDEYYAAQLEELQTVVEHARSLDAENRRLAYQLQERDRMIADLEAKVASGAASDVELNDVQEHGAPHSAETEMLDEVEIASTELSDYIEEQVKAITSYALEPTAEHESQTARSKDCPQPEQESSNLEAGDRDDCSVKKEQDAQVEPELQVFQPGDTVQITSSRQGDEFVGLLGLVLVANTSGCVVEVSDKAKWFCSDEIVLVSVATSQAPPEQEKNALAAIKPGEHRLESTNGVQFSLDKTGQHCF